MLKHLRSGVADVGEAGADGYGTILSGSLERSNVDITEELVNLITAQRNFQANAKTIETNTVKKGDPVEKLLSLLFKLRKNYGS